MTITTDQLLNQKTGRLYLHYFIPTICGTLMGCVYGLQTCCLLAEGWAAALCSGKYCHPRILNIWHLGHSAGRRRRGNSFNLPGTAETKRGKPSLFPLSCAFGPPVCFDFGFGSMLSGALVSLSGRYSRNFGYGKALYRHGAVGSPRFFT